MNPCGHVWSVALTQTTHFRLALASSRRWTFSALCRMDSLIPGSGMRCPFLLLRSPWQRFGIPTPLLLGLRAFLYRLYQRENNRNGRLLYPVRVARFYLFRTAPHWLRCERSFVSAGYSTKEILKTSVSFWLRKSMYRASLLSSARLLVPAPQAWVLRCIAPFSSFEKIFAVDQVSKACTGAESFLFRATTYGTLLISLSMPSTWVLWWRLRPWSHHGLLAWTCHDTLLWTDICPCGPLSVFSRPLAIPVGCPVRESVCHHL